MHMAHLDFSRKWERTGTSEEISMVGETLNTLSSKLNQALEDLQQSNTALQVQLDKATESSTCANPSYPQYLMN